MKYNDMVNTTTEDLKKLIPKYLPNLTYYRARAISVSLLTHIYDLPYSDFYYDIIKDHWTKKISKILKRWCLEGKLRVYTTSNRGILYKKVNKK